ncbi:hypothetical protein ACFE04_015282 [Oxalis oulophora]
MVPKDKMRDRVFGIPIVQWEQWCLGMRNSLAFLLFLRTIWCTRDEIEEQFDITEMRDCVFGIPIVSWEQWCLDEIEEQFGIPIVFENNGALRDKNEWCTRDEIEEQFDIIEIRFGILIVSWKQWCLKNKIKDCLFGIPIVSWEQWCLDEIEEQFDIPIVFENNGALRDKNVLQFGIPIVSWEQWNNGASG